MHTHHTQQHLTCVSTHTSFTHNVLHTSLLPSKYPIVLSLICVYRATTCHYYYLGSVEFFGGRILRVSAVLYWWSTGYRVRLQYKVIKSLLETPTYIVLLCTGCTLCAHMRTFNCKSSGVSSAIFPPSWSRVVTWPPGGAATECAYIQGCLGEFPNSSFDVVGSTEEWDLVSNMYKLHL